MSRIWRTCAEDVHTGQSLPFAAQGEGREVSGLTASGPKNASSHSSRPFVDAAILHVAVVRKCVQLSSVRAK
jgi:hypothetical protein